MSEDYADLTAPMDFPADSLLEVPVTIAGKKYLLREALADHVYQYRNAIGRSPKFDDGKLTNMGNISDAEALLLSFCLLEVLDNGGVRGITPRRSARTLPTGPSSRSSSDWSRCPA